jgi:hypothetical protein
MRITAVRKLAVEAADNGLLAPELANGITRVKGGVSKGVRLGNWLTAKQAQSLLNAPDATRIKGLRDRAILAVLLGIDAAPDQGERLLKDLPPALRTPALRGGGDDPQARPAAQSRRPNPGYCLEREGLPTHPALRGDRGCCRNRAPRLPTHMCEVARQVAN